MYHVRNFPLRIARNGGADYFVGLYGQHDQPSFLAALIDREVRYLTFQGNYERSLVEHVMKHTLLKERNFLTQNIEHFYRVAICLH